MCVVAGLLLTTFAFGQSPMPEETQEDAATKRVSPAVPGRPSGKVDLVLDTDAYNEVDDQFAIAFAALAPDHINLKAVTAAPFLNRRSTSFEDGMEQSYDEILRILKLLDLPTDNAFRGSKEKLPDVETPVDSPAAREIIRLAHESRDGPLYVVGLGSATNIASALLLDPSIKERIVVVWIGGHPYYFPHARDFNLKQDIPAAQVLFNSDVPLVHIPAGDVSEQLSVSLRDLRTGVQGKSKIGDELYNRVAAYQNEVSAGSAGDDWTKVIWDIATIAWIVDPEHSVQTKVVARPTLQSDGTWLVKEPSDHGQIRVAIDVDTPVVFQHVYDVLERE